MKKQATFLLLLITFILMTSCRPDQAGTEYNIADQIVIEDNSALPPQKSNDPEEGEEVPAEGSQRSLDEYVADCNNAEANNAMLEQTYTISFPAAIECDFNEAGINATDLNDAGNGPRINGWMMARHETYQPIDFPADSTLCDARFNFPEQSMKYDDEIFLTMNNNILIASTDFSVLTGEPNLVNGLATNDLGLVQWNWLGNNGLHNLPYVNTPKYCLGLFPTDDDYDDKCSIPETDTLGRMKLDLPANEAIKLNMKNNTSQINFGFITTGDNDNGDCEHSAYNFDVTVKYIQN